MTTTITNKAMQMARENSRDRLWHRIAAISTALTVIAGAFAFAAPALALEAEPVCGLTPHTHTEVCFEERLVCALEQGAAVTTEDGLEAVHAHNNGCYETVLVCAVPEHEHSDDCYSVQPAADAAAEGTDEGADEQAEDAASGEQAAAPEPAQTQPAPETEGTVTIEEDAAPMDIQTVQLYEDDQVRIYAVYDDEALPAGAELVASPITAESAPEDYAQLLEQAGLAPDDAAALPMVLYSIRFEVDGEEVEPTAPVEIKVEFNKDAYEVSEEMAVVHFTEDGAETLETETAVADNTATFQTGVIENADAQ